MLHSLARQWILVWRQPMRLFGRISRSPRCAVGDDFKIVSVFSASRFDSGYMLLSVHIVVGPYSAHCFVRPLIHTLRLSTENFTYSYVIWWITDPEVDSCPALVLARIALVSPWSW